MQDHHRGLLLVNVSVLILAGVPLFAKWIDLPAQSIIFYRCLIGALALGVYLKWRGERLRPDCKDDVWKILLMGAVLGIHWATYFHSIQISTVAVAITSLFIYPAMTVVLEPWFNGKRPALVDMALALVALAGIALIVPRFELGEETFVGAAWGVFSAFFFALRNVIYKRWLSHYGGGRTMFYQLLVAGLVLLPLVVSPTEVELPDWGLIAILALFFTAFAHSLFVGSMQFISAKTLGLVACLQPVYAIVIAWIVLAEQPTVRTLIGAGVVVVVAMVESRRAAKG